MTAPDSDPVRDAVVIVTGGASGIGRATCRALAAAGACVVAVDVNDGALGELLAEMAPAAADQKRHLAMTLDVSSESDMQRMADAALAQFGRIDALVACAGILRARGTALKPLAQVEPDEWDQVIGINLRGLFLSNRAVLPAMQKQRRGDIINVSSVSGRQGRAHDGPYCASKFGVIGMTESLAEEVRNAGIRVQMILPDAVATPFWQQNGPVPMPANALPPERIADLILFMLRLPSDSMLVSPTIAPFRTRVRVGAKRSDAPGTEPRP